jgi:hypothetical protein
MLCSCVLLLFPQVNMAKAGLCATLPARTTILAAANPAEGHYNRSKSVADNLKMSPAMLSRCDGGNHNRRAAPVAAHTLTADTSSSKLWHYLMLIIPAYVGLTSSSSCWTSQVSSVGVLAQLAWRKCYVAASDVCNSGL